MRRIAQTPALAPVAAHIDAGLLAADSAWYSNHCEHTGIARSKSNRGHHRRRQCAAGLRPALSAIVAHKKTEMCSQIETAPTIAYDQRMQVRLRV